MKCERVVSAALFVHNALIRESSNKALTASHAPEQALVMMGGPAGRVAAVRAYALRSLQACNPDQVTPLHNWYLHSKAEHRSCAQGSLL